MQNYHSASEMKQSEQIGACWDAACRMQIPTYAWGGGGGKSRGDIVSVTWSHALTRTSPAYPLCDADLIWNTSSHTALYLSNKAAICIFAVPNEGFEKKTRPSNLWRET